MPTCPDCKGFGEFGSKCEGNPNNTMINHMFNSTYPDEPKCLFCDKSYTETMTECKRCKGTGTIEGE